jgi:hypothetical protein
MSRDPAVLFYTSDFLTGSSRMTDEQCGQYIRALCSQHQEGHFTRDELLHILKSHDSPVWKKFTQDSDGLFFNTRMEEEIQNRLSYCNSRSHKGKAGRKKKSYDNHTISTRKSYGNHTENDNDNEIKNDFSEGGTGETLKPEKKKYIDYVYLTDDEYSRLKIELGQVFLDACITKLDAYLSNDEKKRKKYRDHNKVIRNWVIDSVREKMQPCPEKVEEKKNPKNILAEAQKKLDAAILDFDIAKLKNEPEHRLKILQCEIDAAREDRDEIARSLR